MRQNALPPDVRDWDVVSEDVPALLRDLRAARQQLALPVRDADLREKIEAAVHAELVKAGMDLDGPPWSYGGGDRWPLARELGSKLTTAVFAVLHPAQDKWEYGTEYEVSSTETVFTPTHSREQAEKWVAESPTDTGLRRRRPAGPWQPVPDEGGNGS